VQNKVSLDNLELSDFDNHKLRQSYLTERGCVIYKPDHLETLESRMVMGNCWGFYCPDCGGGVALPGNYSAEHAETYAFYFIWHYFRMKELNLDIPECYEIAYKKMMEKCGDAA